MSGSDPGASGSSSAFPRRPWIWVIEAFSVVTAFAFVFSALVNAVIFWRFWGLNYFLIASPGDVIMSGFIVVVYACGVVFPVLFLLWMTGPIFGSLRRILRIDNYSKHFRQAVSISLAITAFVALPMILFLMNGRTINAPRPTCFNSEYSRDLFIREYVPESRAWDFRSDAIICESERDYSGAIDHLPREVVEEGFAYPTGLKMSPDYDPAFECGEAPVLWLGASRALIQCGRGRRLISVANDAVMLPTW